MATTSGLKRKSKSLFCSRASSGLDQIIAENKLVAIKTKRTLKIYVQLFVAPLKAFSWRL